MLYVIYLKTRKNRLMIKIIWLVIWYGRYDKHRRKFSELILTDDICQQYEKATTDK